MTRNEISIEMVRKHGVIKVESKDEATKLIAVAKTLGYTFGYKKQGWSNLVIDNDL